MMPAYDTSRWYAVFFVVYIVTNMYMLMAIFLAVVYNGSAIFFFVAISINWLNATVRMQGAVFWENKPNHYICM
jgi:hypothetical protein